MSIAAKARVSAQRGIAKAGKAIVYVRVEPGEAGETSELRYAGTAVLTGPSYSELASGMLEATSQVALLAAADWPFEPAPGDRVEINEKQAMVRAVRPTWAGEEVALWRLIIER